MLKRYATTALVVSATVAASGIIAQSPAAEPGAAGAHKGASLTSSRSPISPNIADPSATVRIQRVTVTPRMDAGSIVVRAPKNVPLPAAATKRNLLFTPGDRVATTVFHPLLTPSTMAEGQLVNVVVDAKSVKAKALPFANNLRNKAPR